MKKQDGISFLTIASGASGFLKIGFRRIGQIVMQHQTDISLIYTHTKCIGRYNDAGAVFFPVGLLLVFEFLAQSGMVIIDRNALFLKELCNLARTLTHTNIHHGRAGNVLQPSQNLLQFIFGLTHHISQIRTLEAHAENILLREKQTFLDIGHHFGSCSGRHSQNRDIGQQRSDGRNMQIRRSEIVTPLRDTVRFVHHQNVHLQRHQAFLKGARSQAFGRNVQKLEITVKAIVVDPSNRIVAHAGMHTSRTNAHIAQTLHLVFHQRHQGSHYDANTLQGQSRHLEGKRLSPTRGHQSQGIFTGSHRLDDIQLQRTKILVAPITFQYIMKNAHQEWISFTSNCIEVLPLKVFSSI